MARLLLAVLLFAQASVAFADCPVDRSMLGHVLVTDRMEGCESSMTVATEYGPLYASRCVVHCTADLQIPTATVAVVRNPADVPVLLAVRRETVPPRRPGLAAPPPGTPPPRILQHAFLI